LIKTIWSVTLSVSNLERSKRFYEDILGLNKKYEYSSYVGFECGGVEIGLRPRSSVEIGKDAASIEFLVDNVDEEYQRLVKKGVKFIVKPHDEPLGRETSELPRSRWKPFGDNRNKLEEILQSIIRGSSGEMNH